MDEWKNGHRDVTKQVNTNDNIGVVGVQMLIKLIHILGSTKWKSPKWPGPCHKSNLKSAPT